MPYRIATVCRPSQWGILRCQVAGCLSCSVLPTNEGYPRCVKNHAATSFRNNSQALKAVQWAHIIYIYSTAPAVLPSSAMQSRYNYLTRWWRHCSVSIHGWYIFCCGVRMWNIPKGSAYPHLLNGTSGILLSFSHQNPDNWPVVWWSHELMIIQCMQTFQRNVSALDLIIATKTRVFSPKLLTS